MPTPKRDEKRLASLRRYLKRRRTVDQISRRFATPKRTVYRQLGYLREAGEAILCEKDSATKDITYRIELK